MPTIRLALLLTLVACNGDDPAAEVFYATPANGQTAVDLGADLVARADALNLPPDYATVEAIRVVDLATDGFVPGTTSIDADVLVFTPSRPWQADARYAWTVDLPDTYAHGPQFGANVAVEGAAVFDTSSDLNLLGASNGNLEGLLCLVLSRPADDDELLALTLTVDDVVREAPEYARPDRADWEPELDSRSDGDAGLDVVCTVTGEGTARIATPDGATSLVEITSENTTSIVAALYRSPQ